MIVKLQKPLAGDTSCVLAYDELRSFQRMIPITEQQKKQLFGNKVKIYAEAVVIEGHLHIIEIVEDQLW